MRPTLVRTAALIGSFAVGATTLSAQSLRDQTRGPSTKTPTHVISVNPFLPLFGYFQAEYEHRVAQNASVGISGSHTKFDDLYTSVDVKLRLYPQERVLENLGISAGLGYGRVKGQDENCGEIIELRSCADRNVSESAPTFGVEAQYQWLLGASRSTAVAIGGGAKRYFISDTKSSGIERVVPTLRLTIGYAF
ncbi:hypothetical protein [Gemmatimonas sp.]|uniref:hypothetical protein n=1 Tax=Gemmatimonas sp. TaxID=1962908 RepID=UPI00286EA242|nr:hypothetical protein [Gemmatimonas sp.]